MLITCPGRELSLDHLVVLPGSCGCSVADAHKFMITRTLPGGGILKHGYFYLGGNSAGQQLQAGQSTGGAACRRRVTRWPCKVGHRSPDPETSAMTAAPSVMVPEIGTTPGETRVAIRARAQGCGLEYGNHHFPAVVGYWGHSNRCAHPQPA